MHSSG